MCVFCLLLFIKILVIDMSTWEQWKERIKTFVSIITSPQVVAQIALPFIIFSTLDELGEEITLFEAFISSSLFLVILPSVFVLIYAKIRKIDLDFINRRDRPPIFAIIMILYGLGLVFFYAKQCSVLFALFLAYFLLIIILMLINFKWKISVHTSGVTVPAVFLFLLFRVFSILFIIIIIFVTLTRIQMKRHTTIQALSGIVVATIVTIAAYGLSFFIFFS